MPLYRCTWMRTYVSATLRACELPSPSPSELSCVCLRLFLCPWHRSPIGHIMNILCILWALTFTLPVLPRFGYFCTYLHTCAAYPQCERTPPSYQRLRAVVCISLCGCADTCRCGCTQMDWDKVSCVWFRRRRDLLRSRGALARLCARVIEGNRGACIGLGETEGSGTWTGPCWHLVRYDGKIMHIQPHILYNLPLFFLSIVVNRVCG
jgi:hypothetical protein